ncbi:MAG TPA: YggT family protein [Candidatus Thiothrix moscowensis]|uniref:YggT family protein n=1 Tax=unclassified Thiothrix TaxID=2636184 RepID=UPI001A1C3B8C|nr:MULTISPECIES: YggT family protein [unclassified Thiothrix]MBJ6608832.1 YggT family protein [Candidatus Thiothrix moscowensis]HRJ51807.1 YggT family protein [Candidatus Thiothrix moscowensis]HRJ92122.1 YggT family protein [Candidatus Thiothrix moscowensis]
MDALQNVGVFLVETLFSLYIGAVIIRFLLALSRANFYNPLSQFLVKITNPVLIPMRRFIPAVGKLDSAAVVLALGLMIIKVFLLLSMTGGDASLPLVAVYSVLELLRTVIHIYIFALIVQAVLSWVGNSYGNPMADILHSLTDPILRPIRNLIPTIGMVDLSPMIAILLLYIVLIVLRSYGL